MTQNIMISPEQSDLVIYPQVCDALCGMAEHAYYDSANRCKKCNEVVQVKILVMCCLQCTVDIQRIIFNVQYTIYNVQYTIYNIQYTIYNIQYTIYNIHI